MRVLLADPRDDLLDLLRGDPGLQVSGVVRDGAAAVEFVRGSPPDVVLMEAAMPGMDGFEATRAIMETCPLPIVICSVIREDDVMVAMHSMEAGAVSCVRKPAGRGDEDAAAAENLLRTLKLMAEVRVVRRWPRERGKPRPPPTAERPGGIRVVAIGASTGGPPVLQAIIAGLPKDFAAPILVVQHISHGFLPGLVEWLSQTTGFRVMVGSHGATPLPGRVYLAPDDFHMGMMGGGQIQLSRQAAENGLRPSVSFLFRSVAETCGHQAIGVLLSGMGKDGAAELADLRSRGATTIAQDRESSVIHGMPGEAIARGGATHVLPAERIAEMLVSLVHARGSNANGDRSK